MPKKWWWKFSFVVVLLLFGVYMLVPSFWELFSTSKIPGFFGEKKIKLGLDLRGGLYLVLGVDIDKALEDRLELYASNLRDAFDEKKFGFSSVKLSNDKESIDVKFIDLSQYEKFSKEIKNYILGSFRILEYVDESSGPKKLLLKLRLVEKEKEYFSQQTVKQSLETIRNRIDEFGVSEPSIQTRGGKRIIIQLPGVKDPERAKQIIGKTAKLEFKIVDETLSPQDLEKLVYESEQAGIAYKKGEKFSDYVDRVNEHLKKRLPEGTVLSFKKEVDKVSGDVKKFPFLLQKVTHLTGEDLKDAFVQMNRQFNEPYVSLSFNPRGAKIFADVTGKYTKKRLAIVLDGIVNSAPYIKSKIVGGHAQIELGAARAGSTVLQEARDIALTLRAGSLPADVNFLEERTVGPSLGYDSIMQGLTAMKYGAVIVIVFMIIYYSISGVLANLALMFNILFIGTILTAFQATLTLPGIAGIVLTIGMAVDANVIIFERIREELDRDLTPANAVDVGFSKAFTAILDANLTTMITGFVLLQYGTGPIKGFAVTLIIGIICSLFSALFITRVFFDLLTGLYPKKLHI